MSFFDREIGITVSCTSYSGIAPSSDSVMGSYTETTSTCDSAAAAQAQANTENTVNSIEEHYEEQVSIWSQTLLGKTTLMPGREITGTIIAKDGRHPGEEHRVNLNLRGDEHSLILRPEG